jgi:Flp pilus assembly protein protease CpaA
MAPYISLANAVLALTAATLLYAAIVDLKRYTISNAVIFTLGVLFLAYTAVTGRWSSLPWHIAIAGIIFAVLLYFYSRSWMGGGDVKMLTTAFLWIGSDGALLFAILLCFFSSIHGLAAKLNWLPSRHSANDARTRIALAPSVAAALIGSLVLLGSQHQI